MKFEQVAGGPVMLAAMPEWGEMTPWQRVDRVARRQHQAITRRQVRECGVCERVLTERVREQAWGRPHRGVLVLPGAPATYELACSAALLSARRPSAVTGVGALYLFRVVTRRPAVVPVAVPGHRFLASCGGVELIRTDHFDHLSVKRVQGLRVAAPAWAFTDLPRHLPYRELGAALVNALRRRLITLDAVDAVADLRSTVAGLGAP